MLLLHIVVQLSVCGCVTKYLPRSIDTAPPAPLDHVSVIITMIVKVIRVIIAVFTYSLNNTGNNMNTCPH